MIIIAVLCTQLALADSLYAHGYYEAARIEYARDFFFYPELEQNLEARMHYAIASLRIDSTQGIDMLNSLVSDFPELPDSFRAEIATQYILAGRYYLAIHLLHNTEEKKLLGLAYLLDDQFSNARAVFIENGDYALAGLIDQYLQNPQKSERNAVLLSIFLPGSGEVYAGNLGLGVRDFFVNLCSGYLFYNAIRQHKYVDASLAFLFLFNRFYLGSLHNAQKTALEYNEKMRREWLDDIVEAIFTDMELKTYSPARP